MRAPGTSTTRSGLYQGRGLAFWAACISVSLLAYMPALTGGFLWDDDGHVCRQALRSLGGLWRIWSDLQATQQYYPVLHSAFWLEWHLWGDATLGYHVVNIVLHGTAAFLVHALARRLGLPGAWLAGLLFALHPVGVETAAWISEQKNTLSTVFVLTATLLYLQFDENRSRRTYLIATGLFILALLTKSVTAMASVAIGIVLWWKHGRLSWRGHILPLMPLVLLGAGAGLFTAWVEHEHIGAQGDDFLLSTGQRLLLAGRIPAFYLYKLVLPVDLSFIYPRWTPDTALPWQWLYPAALACMVAFCWFVRRRTRGPFTSLLVFLCLLFPVLGFVNVYPFRFSYVADHFQYLASIAFFIPAAAILVTATRRLPSITRAGAAAVLLTTLGAATWQQSQIYRDKESLYRHTLTLNPACWMACNNLGTAISNDPARIREAEDLFAKAITLKPDDPEAYFNLANLLARDPARFDEAVLHYETALRLRPVHADAHNNYGALLARQPGRLPDAVRHFQEAISLNPDLAQAHNNLGTALARDPAQFSAAIRSYREALKLNPDNAEFHFNLGNALARSPASHSDAIREYETALRLHPDYVEAHVNLGYVLSQEDGKGGDALFHYEQALQRRPDLEQVRRAAERLKTNQP